MTLTNILCPVKLAYTYDSFTVQTFFDGAKVIKSCVDLIENFSHIVALVMRYAVT